MEQQQEKSWVVKVQRTASSPVEVVGTGYDTKCEANRVALKVWTDDVFRAFAEYE